MKFKCPHCGKNVDAEATSRYYKRDHHIHRGPSSTLPPGGWDEVDVYYCPNPECKKETHISEGAVFM